MIDYLIQDKNWKHVATLEIPSRTQIVESFNDLDVSKETLTFLSNAVHGLYVHQKKAIKYGVRGNNICLLTGTASGKSLPFYALGIESITKNKDAKVIAVYPLKALGREQEKRWQKALQTAGLMARVGRIDGDVKTPERKTILKNCQVVVMTPDIIHSWLLPNTGESDIAKFIKNIAMIVIDEVHTYTGVFGSNAAFLFRRIRHLMSLVNKNPQFICASATMASPEKHLQNLFGVEFELIEENLDTSPKHEVKIELLKTPTGTDYLTEITLFLKKVSQEYNRFIAFVDSRKQAEIITSILSRGQEKDNDIEDNIDGDLISYDTEHLKKLNILPYRSGYEENDQQVIQERLSKGTLKGVVSTSALELGLDIAGLDVAVLIGVPYSATSLKQRIGRIGRHCAGTVYIIHSGNFYDEIVFRNPQSLLDRPLAEGALYLQNPRVQYIHALCLSREGGEHDQFCSSQKIGFCEDSFKSPIDWPDGFISVCTKERTGEISADFQAMKSESGDTPNHTYPLRDVESQFKVYLKQGPILEELGSLSYSQLLREAYPGAVYYYATKSFRVQKIMQRSRIVYVRGEKKYTTSPSTLFKQVYPNFSEGNIHNALRYGELVVIEANCQVRESVPGFKEKRGSKETISYTYPLKGSGINVFFDLPRFTRNYFTSGVIFSHPALDVKPETLETVSRLIYEAFLMSIPFERQDIDVSVGKLKVSKSPYIEEGKPFIVIYDRTYGSLRLSGHVMRDNYMQQVLKQALQITELSAEVIGPNGQLQITEEVISLINTLINEAHQPGSKIHLDDPLGNISDHERYEKVILPGNTGLAIKNGNVEYIIDRVFYSPKYRQLCYKGRYLNQNNDDTLNIIWTVQDIREIPGESKIGYYDYETGEILENIKL